MPNPNTAPPGYFRVRSDLEEGIRQAVTRLDAIGVAVEGLPVDDPVRVAVEEEVSGGKTTLDGIPWWKTGDEPPLEE